MVVYFDKIAAVLLLISFILFVMSMRVFKKLKEKQSMAGLIDPLFYDKHGSTLKASDLTDGFKKCVKGLVMGAVLLGLGLSMPYFKKMGWVAKENLAYWLFYGPGYLMSIRGIYNTPRSALLIINNILKRV